MDKYGELPPLMKPLPDDKDLVHDYYQVESWQKAIAKPNLPKNYNISQTLHFYHMKIDFEIFIW